MVLRQTIVEECQKGASLQSIAQRHQVSYSRVQHFCQQYTAQGADGLLTHYKHCGKSRPSPTDFVYRAVGCYKRWHPSWGAEKIRQQMLLLRPDLVVPPARTLQKWFHYQQLVKGKDKMPRQAPQWAKAVHEGWQVDAKEEVLTLDGRKNCWLNIKDEHSGAVIDPVVFPLQKDL